MWVTGVRRRPPSQHEDDLLHLVRGLVHHHPEQVQVAVEQRAVEARVRVEEQPQQAAQAVAAVLHVVDERSR